MSTWRNVGITYLKYADICATHVRNALKEPARQAKSRATCTRAHAMGAGKRGEPRELRLPPLRVALPSYHSTGAAPRALMQIPAKRKAPGETAGGCMRPLPRFLLPPPPPHAPSPIIYPHPGLHVQAATDLLAAARPPPARAAAYAACPESQKSSKAAAAASS